MGQANSNSKADGSTIAQDSYEFKNNDVSTTVQVKSDTNLGNETMQYEMEEGMPVGHQISPAMRLGETAVAKTNIVRVVVTGYYPGRQRYVAVVTNTNGIALS